ncbi:MAG: hypothetical protein P8049_11675, partial [Gemmatimonadota bacterium]
MLVLPVQVHEGGAQFSDQPCGRGGSVDPGPIPPLTLQLPLQDEPAVRQIDPGLIATLQEERIVGNLEHSLDQGPLFPRTNHLGGRPLPEQQRESSHHDRLPRPGLAAQHRETGTELDAD